MFIGIAGGMLVAALTLDMPPLDVLGAHRPSASTLARLRARPRQELRVRVDHRVRRQPPRAARRRRREQRRPATTRTVVVEHLLHHRRRRAVRDRRDSIREAVVTTPLVECRDVVGRLRRQAGARARRSRRSSRGEIVALLGGSGCGKSTLLRTLIGLLPPLAGEVLPVRRAALRARRSSDRDRLLRRTGIAFQQDALFGSMTSATTSRCRCASSRELPEPDHPRDGRACGSRSSASPASSSAIADEPLGRPAQARRARARVDPRSRADVLRRAVAPASIPSSPPTIDEHAARSSARRSACTLVVVSHELESIRAIADRAVMLAQRHASSPTGTIDELSTARTTTVYNFFHRVAGSRTRRREA